MDAVSVRVGSLANHNETFYETMKLIIHSLVLCAYYLIAVIINFLAVPAGCGLKDRGREAERRG